MPKHWYEDEPRGRPMSKWVPIVAALAVAAIVAGIVLFMRARDPLVLLRAEKPRLDSLTAQYCRVYESDKTLDPTPRPREPLPVPVPVKTVGAPDLHEDSAMNDGVEGGNADTIELHALAALCSDAPRPSSRVWTSVLARVVSRADQSSFKRSALARVLALLQRIEFLFVLRVDEYVPSTAVGTRGLTPGHFSGTVALYRLDGAQRIVRVVAQGESPKSAVVFGLPGQRSPADAERWTTLMLDGETRRAFERTIDGAFGRQGLTTAVDPVAL